MSNDLYEKIRKALEMGPTPGPWSPSYDKGSTRDIFTEQGKLPVCMVRGVTYVGQKQYLANGHFIAACDPDTIRELLDERDALAAEVEQLAEALKKVVQSLEWYAHGSCRGFDDDAPLSTTEAVDLAERTLAKVRA